MILAASFLFLANHNTYDDLKLLNLLLEIAGPPVIEPRKIQREMVDEQIVSSQLG